MLLRDVERVLAVRVCLLCVGGASIDASVLLVLSNDPWCCLSQSNAVDSGADAGAAGEGASPPTIGTLG